MPHSRFASFGLTLSLLLASAAWSDNPRLSLKLADVTGAEAVAALSKASGIQIEMPDARFNAAPQVEEALKQRATFDWSSVRFATAFRQLCDRYNLRPNRSPAGAYTLFPAAGPAVPAARKVGFAEKAGVRVWMRRISISSQREIAFDDQGFGDNPGNMSLQLSGEMPDGDASTFAGIANVTARDDLGNLTTQDPMPWRAFGGDFGGGLFPDEFSAYATLPAPHPKARKLVWIEGDVMVHKEVKPILIEIPLPLPERGATREVRGVTAEVTRVEKEPDPPDPNPFNTNQVSVQARLSWVPDSRIQPAGRGVGTVWLRGASGKRYVFASGGSGGGGGAARVTYNYNLTFSGVSEPVTAVVFSLVEKSEPERLMSFRMTDIPLPGDPAFIPRRAVARPNLPNRSSPATPERPFQAPGGGALVSRIRIAGEPAPEGTLQLGLAAKEGDGWSGVRWTEVAVGADGVARYPELKPGTYRVLRVYRVKEAPKQRTDGTWQNSEATVEVTAGKETTVPDLAWTAVPAAVSKPSLPKRPSNGKPAKR